MHRSKKGNLITKEEDGGKVKINNIQISEASTLTVKASGSGSVSNASGAILGNGARLTVMTNCSPDEYDMVKRRFNALKEKRLQERASKNPSSNGAAFFVNSSTIDVSRLTVGSSESLTVVSDSLGMSNQAARKVLTERYSKPEESQPDHRISNDSDQETTESSSNEESNFFYGR